MAIDVYLFIEGIKGESNDDMHKGWIECTSGGWDIKQPKSATASTSGGHTAERCEHDDIDLHKTVDLASPLLALYCSAGKTFPKAKLEFFRADGQGERVKYFEVELENVIISRVRPSFGEGDLLSEIICLKYGKVRWKYVQQRITGGSAGNTAGGWDLSTNRIIA
jgi:type VI secretion system secreted protein Hcp